MEHRFGHRVSTQPRVGMGSLVSANGPGLVAITRHGAGGTSELTRRAPAGVTRSNWNTRQCRRAP
jgi:hypothetical protein